MIDDINYSDDIDFTEDDFNDSDFVNEASLVEINLPQEDQSLVDSSLTIDNAIYENVSSVEFDYNIIDNCGTYFSESIPDLSALIHEQLPEGWINGFHDTYGEAITDDEIIQSVQQASEFFNLNSPMEIWEGWTTGVINGKHFTENDDILIFNREQLEGMGVTDKEGFDLVMTHEGAHRALQGLNMDFSEQQEELCCDYMAGVRAGMNGLDAGKIISTFNDCEGCDSHPEGVMRIQAIEQGVAFAHEYLENHDGLAPSFSDCLESFEQSEVYTEAMANELRIMAEGLERAEPHGIIKYFKMCPTRHGCHGATYCDNSYGDYSR